MQKLAKKYTIKASIAMQKNIPRVFVATELAASPRGAVYLYGHGSTDPISGCRRCGRTLTHPGSILLGIGPECLSKMGSDGWGERAARFNFQNPDPVDVAVLREYIAEIKVDTWLPKWAIKDEDGCDEVLFIPDNHKMLSTQKPQQQQTRAAALADPFVIITFPFDADLLQKVRTLEGRQWVPEKKHWKAWASQGNLQLLESWGFALDQGCLDLLKPKEVRIELPEDSTLTALFPFQKEGVEWLEAHNGNGLIGDEMGLGKTVQALAYLRIHPEQRPAVVVCPASLKRNWERESYKWLGASAKVDVLSGTDPAAYKAENFKESVIIVNYDILAPSYNYNIDAALAKKVWKAAGLHSFPKNLDKAYDTLWSYREDMVRTPKLEKMQPEVETLLKQMGVVAATNPKHRKKWKTMEKEGLGTFIESLKPEVLILDEAQYIKNRQAARTKAVKSLRKKVKCLIPLTGTPIENRTEEFFSILNMLDKREFPSWLHYVQRYCGAYHDGWGWQVGGATNTAELFDRVNKKLMLRRKKADVLKELPAKRRIVVPIEIENRKEYNRAATDLLTWVHENFGGEKASAANRAEALARYNYLKQIALQGKLKNSLEWIRDALEANGKLVLFAVHHETIDLLKKELKDFNPVVVDGRVPQNKRQDYVDKFQNDATCKIFIGNIRAAGVGLTLTAASNTVFLEMDWVPGAHDQAEDRVHRIGQTHSCNAWYLLAVDTVEEELAEIIDTKRRVIDATVDGKETEESDILIELLERSLAKVA